MTASDRRRFMCIAGSGVLVLTGYVVLGMLRLGGDRPSVVVEDLLEAGVALFAAGACAYSSRLAEGGARLAWALLAGSALIWTAGQLVSTAMEATASVHLESAADASFLLAIPLAIAGVMSFLFASGDSRGQLRLLLDGGIVSVCVIYVAWAVGLSDAYLQARIDTVSKFVVLAYAAGDLVLLTVVGASLRRVSPESRAVMGLLFAAFAATLLSNASLAVFSLLGGYNAPGYFGDTGWVAGYLLLGLAAVRAAGTRVTFARGGDVEMWQFAIPWVAVAAVIAASFWATFTHRQLPALGFIGTVMGVLFISSQVWAASDAIQLVGRSRRAETQLRDRTALLDEIIGRAPLGIARISDDFRFIDVNPSLCALLAAPERALIGSSMRQFLADEEIARAGERMALMRSGQLAQAEVDSEMRCADGRKVWVHRTVTPVLDSTGRIDYYLVMFEDTTVKHETEQAGVANLAALERIDRLKSEFMSMVSHEFRTALTGIQGYSELMSSEEVSSDEVKEFAGDINSDALRLNRMITEMLDLDRIESGRMAMHMEPMDLNRILTETVERARMSTSRHEVITRLDPRLPRIEGDADRLTQVVANLLTNAVKYAPEGGQILVSSRTENGTVEVSVQDHGLGIPPEFISRIFGRYERYEGDGKSQIVGTGLGLAIAQQIIQLHKGRIWVESMYGQGSTFRFTIPAATPDNKVA